MTNTTHLPVVQSGSQLVDTFSGELEAAIREAVAAASSENTKRAYRAQMAKFTSWCEAHGKSAMPTDPATVAAFMAFQSLQGAKIATIRLSLAAISQAHRVAGFELDPG